MSWNQVAIHLNNQAMIDLHERGDVLTAYLNLSGAVSAIGLTNAEHRHETLKEAEAIAAAYSYTWIKCSSEAISKNMDPQASEGYLPFLCLRFLRIRVNDDTNVDIGAHCPCQFSWAIYYK